MTRLPLVLLSLLLTIPAFADEVYSVKSTADSGPGTLRDAIEFTNTRCGANTVCRILFDLPAGSTIELLTPLPVIKSCNVRMTANREIAGNRRLEITGRRLTTGSGFELVDADCVGEWRIEDLAINDFPDFAVLIRDRGPHVYLSGLFLGTDITGRIARPNNRGVGVFRERASTHIENSIISGNRRSGIFQWNGNTRVNSSLVGLSSDRLPLGNGASGAFAAFGTLFITSTTIANNGEFGVSVYPTLTNLAFLGGSIHSNGILGIDWNLDGPSPFPADERIPPPPAINDAFFDQAKGVTVVTGTASARSVRGVVRSVQLYASRALNPSGHAEGERYVGGTTLVDAADGFTFRIEIGEDLRGQIIAATVSSSPLLDVPPTYTTEFSTGVTAR